MTFLRLVSILTVVVNIYYAGAIDCGDYEALDDCPVKCAYDTCAKIEKQELDVFGTCQKPGQCPPPACKCIFNYRRAENGTCIPTEDCPPFQCNRPNEEYFPCPSVCPTDSCNQATIDGRCPLPGVMLFVVRCTPACRCRKGYWRNNGTCVPYEQCPEKRLDNIRSQEIFIID